ncbi:pentapeptide repeat-containing protein [Tardiphaga sp. 619_E2_N8_5]|jgi:uncharacterized protein YjbI with pentapeptide repeats|uniref:pentapeptide repeat-containing protein n=1 Tax=unclassified Tardiphaga TaxID=2631404 RepID=UPI003F271BCA
MFETTFNGAASIWEAILIACSYLSGGANFVFERISSQILIVLIALLIIVGLLAYFWAWQRAPQAQVPIHLSAKELKVIEVQDQLRKTQIQIPFVLAIIATFILVVTQFGISSRQWTNDFELRTAQAQLGLLSEAIQSLTSPQVERSVSGAYSLEQLAALDPDKHLRRVDQILASSIRSKTTKDILRASVECDGRYDGRPKHREEVAEDIQAAIDVIGNPNFSQYFSENYSSAQKTCVWGFSMAKQARLARRPNFNHLYMDDISFAASDRSCGRFSGTFLRRTSFEGSKAEGADFRASIFNNRATGLDAALSIEREGLEKRGKPFNAAHWVHAEIYNQWKRYRCWSVFFFNATLTGAKFNHAHLAGAVFQNAHLKDADFGGADVSLADFRGTAKRGFTKEQLQAACIRDKESKPLHDFDDNLSFTTCDPAFLQAAE